MTDPTNFIFSSSFCDSVTIIISRLLFQLVGFTVICPILATSFLERGSSCIDYNFCCFVQHDNPNNLFCMLRSPTLKVVYTIGLNENENIQVLDYMKDYHESKLPMHILR